jgi:hypothetical protein
LPSRTSLTEVLEEGLALVGEDPHVELPGEEGPQVDLVADLPPVGRNPVVEGELEQEAAAPEDPARDDRVVLSDDLGGSDGAQVTGLAHGSPLPRAAPVPVRQAAAAFRVALV